MDFKKDNNFEARLAESSKIMNKYPMRVPIIVEKCSKSTAINDIDKNKYLVPKDLNMNQFVYIIRKRIKIDKSQSIFIMINNSLCPSNTPMGVVYETHKDKDGFLYIKYTNENTFG